jgi:hypothetical protein
LAEKEGHAKHGFYPELMPLMPQNDLFYNEKMASDRPSTKIPVLFITTLCDIKQILLINCWCRIHFEKPTIIQLVKKCIRILELETALLYSKEPFPGTQFESNTLCSQAVFP